MHTAQLSLDAPPPATRVSATSVFHRLKWAALTALTALTPAMGRPSGTRDWHSGSGNCGNPYRRPAPATPGIPRQATAERWVRWWVGIAISATSGVFTALFGSNWRRGWDSNPRYACTHNGFRDRPDRPLWHLSGAPLIGGRFCPGNSAVGGSICAFSAWNQGFPALTWGASCVYSALLRRVIQARRALSCFPAFWAWVRPIPLSVVGWIAGSAQPEGFSQVSS